jgi:aspartate racemase
MKRHIIGIVGGIGPLAGIDLCKKVVENSIANSDQQHIPFLLSSIPDRVADRTEYILGNIKTNPGPSIAELILELEKSGATVIGIACNTAHSPQIFDAILSELKQQRSNVLILNMIDETIQIIKSHKIQKIAVLSTSGSYKTKLYQNKLSEAGLTPIVLDFEMHSYLVHDAIYNAEYGIKSTAKTSDKSIKQINSAIEELKNQGAQGIILGCTEIGMIEDELDLQGLISFNPSTILARALIKRTYPGKLKQPVNFPLSQVPG